MDYFFFFFFFFFFLLFLDCLCCTVLSVSCILGVTCWKTVDLLALLCDVFSCICLTSWSISVQRVRFAPLNKEY